MTLLDLAYIPVAAAFLPSLLRKKRGGWRERFGHGDSLPEATRPRVLLHAVSVGEVNALRALVPLLTSECEVVVSATTDTGLERARALYGSQTKVVRFPLDTSDAVRRFVDRLKPDVVALTELEVWPQFMRECARRRVPVGVINGRLSERSFRGYRKIRFFMDEFFGGLSWAAVQNEEYAARFVEMGVAREKCTITGSMKWDAISLLNPGQIDAAAEQLAAELGVDRKRPLVVAGSTGPGEEALMHRSVPEGVQLLCAPRKTERFDEAAAALPRCVRRAAKLTGASGSSRFLLDTIGELRLAYMLADVVVVGRSFFDLFGSDPIEPIALGKPVVIGPAVSDFAEIVREFEVAGGLCRADRESLAGMIKRLLSDPVERAQLATAGIAVIRRQQGASARHAELILDVVKQTGKPRSVG
ncbi:MAG: glycosyltransferase [Planctomycetes bacterium]|nr:glycosyltransferase [Planctomycetota bacterium]